MGRLIGHDTKGLPITALDGVLCLLESAWRLCEASLLPMYVWGDPGGDGDAAVGGDLVCARTGSFTGAKHLWITSIYDLGCCYVNNVSHRVFGQP